MKFRGREKTGVDTKNRLKGRGVKIRLEYVSLCEGLSVPGGQPWQYQHPVGPGQWIVDTLVMDSEVVVRNRFLFS